MRARALIVPLVAMLSLLACQGSATVTESSSPSVAGADASDSSTTSSVTRSDGTAPYRLYPPGISPAPDAGVEGHLELKACRWRRPGIITFDLNWTSFEESSWPATIPIWLELGSYDVGDGYLVDVTLGGPADFTVSFDLYEARARQVKASGIRRWYASRSAADGVEWCSVSWFVKGQIPFGPLKDLEVDLIPGEPAVAGGLEEIVSGIDPFDLDAPLLPLVSLLSHTDLPAIDRLFVHPTLPLLNVWVNETGSCLSIRTDYGDLGPFVTQNVGCPRGQDEGGGPERTLLADDVWEITVSGTDLDAERIAAELVAIPLVEVERFTVDRAQVDPDSLIDARLIDEPRLFEIARLNWSDGRVAVLRGQSFTACCETYIDTIAVTADYFNPTAIALECRDYSRLILDDDHDKRAFLLVVTQSPGYRVNAVADGFAVEVPLDSALGGREVGILDLTGSAAPRSIEVTVTDSNDHLIACVQD